MAEIHPVFANIPDAQAAEALSELITNHEQFRIATLLSDEQSERLADNPDFPPIPCYMSEVTIAYLQDDGQTRRQFADVQQGGSAIDHNAARADHLRAYSTLNGLHEAQPEEELPTEIAQYHAQLLNRIRGLGMRTISALVTYSSPQVNEHFTGLMLPKRLSRDIPLEVRQALMNTPARGGISDGADATMAEIMGEIIRQEPSAEATALYMLSLSLPKYSAVKSAMEQRPVASPEPKPADDPRYAGLSRTERRKLQAKERRANRREQS